MKIKDLARISGVSVSTVSRVLNDHPDVSAETRDRIKSIIEQSNYVPNLGARILSKSETNNIGLVVRGMSNPFYTNVIVEIEKDIEEAGYSLYTQQIGTQDDELMTAALMERDKKLQGVIFLGGRLDYTARQMVDIDVPYVFCSFNNKYGTLAGTDYSSVCIDDNQAAYEAVKKLYACGHRKIAILLPRVDDGSISQMRYEGYERALKDFAIPMDENLILSANGYGIENAYQVMRKHLKKGKDFTAVFVISDLMAIGAMRALIDAGYFIPRDCSIIAIDGIEISNYIYPRLSTFEQPNQQMGAETVKQLVRLIEEPDAPHRHLILPIAFLEGETIAAPESVKEDV